MRKARPDAEVGLGVADVGLHQRLLAQHPRVRSRRLRAGELGERLEGGAADGERHRRIARGEAERARDLVQRARLHERRGGGEDGALGGHEHVVHGEVVRARPAHAADMPGVEELDLADGHVDVARLGLTVGVEPHLAVLDDLHVGRDPRGVAAARAEALAAGDAEATGYDDGRGRGGGGVGDDGARRVDPDRAGDGVRHARGVRGVDRALVDRPRRARVGLAELLDDLHIGRQVELGAAEGARDRHVVEPGVRERLEERARQLALRLDLVGGGADLGGELAGGVHQRSRCGCGHGLVEAPCE